MLVQCNTKKNLEKTNFIKTKGIIEVQILIDENGTPCLLSVQNKYFYKKIETEKSN